MQLIPQHLAEIVETIKRQEHSSAGSDKRRFTRFAIIARVELMNPASGRTYTALTRDLSQEGVGLTQSTSMAHGEKLTVSLPRGKNGSLLAHCKVAHVRELADGLWGIGASFLSTVPQAPVDPKSKVDLSEAQRIAARMFG
jgi:hypothetical protein